MQADSHHLLISYCKKNGIIISCSYMQQNELCLIAKVLMLLPVYQCITCNNSDLYNYANKIGVCTYFSCRILVVDLSDPDAASTASEKALKLFDRIDILVNNAGINYIIMMLCSLIPLSHTFFRRLVRLIFNSVVSFWPHLTMVPFTCIYIIISICCIWNTNP